MANSNIQGVLILRLCCPVHEYHFDSELIGKGCSLQCGTQFVRYTEPYVLAVAISVLLF